MQGTGILADMTNDLTIERHQVRITVLKKHFHQEYVDRRMRGLTREQRARVGQLWEEKKVIDPDMPNRGQSFVRILEHVAEGRESISNE